MNNRQRALAILRYQNYDRLPLVHFGFWPETLYKWHKEGYLTKEEIKNAGDTSPGQIKITEKLGFDFNWFRVFGRFGRLNYGFKSKVIEEMADGSRKVMNNDGVIILQKPGAGSIPAEIDHTLKDRKSWEEHYIKRLQFEIERVDTVLAKKMRNEHNDLPLGAYCGSLYGDIRNIMGIIGTSYILIDDEPLFDEIIETFGELNYKYSKAVFDTGVDFDFAHFWEDICFKNGPLVNPKVFRKKVGPYYKRITDLARSYGIDIISLDCDGKIDELIPIWIENGVNTMFPIEVGTWGASILPWRKKYGRQILGVGGMDKKVFAMDYKAVDREIERLKPLVELGGYIPCPDHRIPPDAKWDNVCYYCEQMRKIYK